MTEKKEKPIITDVINNVLSGIEKDNANSFISYLESKKLKPTYSSANAWKVSYKGRRLCYIRLYGTAHYHRIPNNSWHINFLETKFPSELSDDFKETIWQNTKFCFSCSNCSKGFKMNILGKELMNVCHSWFVMKNPSAKTLEYAKKLIDFNTK